jgi:hypothetical protein
VSFLRSLLQSWIPVGVAFALGTVVVGGIAIAHPGSPAFLHSGHSDTMNGTLTAKDFEYKKAKRSASSFPVPRSFPTRMGTRSTTVGTPGK